MIIAFRRHTPLPLRSATDDPACDTLGAASVPGTRHGIFRLPDVDGDKPKRQTFKRDPMGFFHIDIAAVQTAEGKLYLFVGIGRTSTFAVTPLVETADRKTAREVLQHMFAAFADMRLILSCPHHSYRSSCGTATGPGDARGIPFSPGSPGTATSSIPGRCAST